MKSVLISYYFPRSIRFEGAGTLLDSVACVLESRGVPTTVFAPLAGTGDVPYRLEDYLKGEKASYRRYLAGLEDLARRHDTVFLFEPSPAERPFRKRFVSSKPRVVRYFRSPVQGFGDLFRNPFSIQYLKHWLSKNSLWATPQAHPSEIYVVGTEYQKSQLLRLGFPDSKIRIIPLGLARVRCRRVSSQEARQTYDLPGGPLVGYLGRFSPVKGVPVLIEAFDKLLEKVPEARLALAWSGRGAEAKRVRRMLDEVPVRGRVSVLGIVEPVRFLSALDVCVLPFVHSSFPHPPLVLVEALAAGTPLVVSDIGGLKEFVTNRRTGLLVPPGDPSALAGGVRELLSDPELLRRIAWNQRYAFENEFAVEAVVDRLLEVL